MNAQAQFTITALLYAYKEGNVTAQGLVSNIETIRDNAKDTESRLVYSKALGLIEPLLAMRGMVENPNND